MRMKMMSALALVVGLQVSTAMADEMMDQAILDNIRPIGSVVVAGESGGSDAAAGGGAAPAAARSGADIVQNTCFACHGTGAAGAPKIGDKAAWGPRADQGEDVLLNHAINGFKAMPPRGTCADCSDDELKAAIEDMLKETGLL